MKRIFLPKSWLPAHQCQIEIRDRVWRKQKRLALLLLSGKRETQQVRASRTVPPFLRNRERFYILLKVLHFFLLQSFKTNSAGITQLSDWVWWPWSYRPMTFFLKCTVLQENVGRGRRMPDMESNLHGLRQQLALWRTSPATSVC